MAKTKIKLCGLSCREDIETANLLLPEYAGFILSEGFRRTVPLEQFRELRKALSPQIQAVGVFVNAPWQVPAELANEGLLDAIQLHGAEDNDYIETLRTHLKRETKIIKAFKINGKEDAQRVEQSAADMIVLDSGTGCGKTFDWSVTQWVKRPFLLAGGLTPDNVVRAIEQTAPFGVDVSSGIETEGKKDPKKMQDFVEAIRKR